MSLYFPTGLDKNNTVEFVGTYYVLKEVVRNLYITANGGENGNNLTGDKFLLKTLPEMEKVKPLEPPRMMGDDAVRTVRTIYSFTKGIEKAVKTMPKF